MTISKEAIEAAAIAMHELDGDHKWVDASERARESARRYAIAALSVQPAAAVVDIASTIGICRSFAESMIKANIQWGLDPRYIIRLCDALSAAPSAPAEAVVGEPAWKDIDGFEGVYQVSPDGEVRSKKSGEWKTLQKTNAGSGYHYVGLWKDSTATQVGVHRLVARAFVEGDGPEVNHKNGVKTDNRAGNLEWCTRSENVNHSYYALGQLVNPVEAYNPDTGEKRAYMSVCEAVRDGFRSANIYRALANPHKKVKGFLWRSIAAPSAPDGWQPIETAEKTSRSHVLLALPNGRVSEGWWGAAKYNRKTKSYDNAWVTSPYSVDVSPTHWRPLPAPPALGDKL